MIQEDVRHSYFHSVETLVATIATVLIMAVLLYVGAFSDALWAIGTATVLYAFIRTILALRKWWRMKQHRRKLTTLGSHLF